MGIPKSYLDPFVMGLRAVGPEDVVAVIVVVDDGAFCSDSVLGWGRSCQFGTVEDYTSKRERQLHKWVFIQGSCFEIFGNSSAGI